ncbi:MAG: addiction module protein [Ginsengibacter sp.]
MDETTYTIKIKNEYASAILEDLKQVDAIEIMKEPIPEWQKTESIKRLAEMRANPASQISEEDFFKTLDERNG